MTHEATFTHPSDPPTGRNPELDKWPAEHSAMLKELVESQEYSFTEITAKINFQFGTSYTRSAIIGRAGRMGLRNTRPDKNAVQNAVNSKPKLRIVRSSGNSNSLKLIESVQRDKPELMAAPDVASLNLTLQELQPASCRYVTQDGPDWRFCGHEKQSGSSYCIRHHRLIWIAPTPNNQRARGWK